MNTILAKNVGKLLLLFCFINLVNDIQALYVNEANHFYL